MRWMPLQNVNSKKWVLCVRNDDCRTYDTTDIVSDSIEQISAYAAYMNCAAGVMGAEASREKGVGTANVMRADMSNGISIDAQMRGRLDAWKRRYGISRNWKFTEPEPVELEPNGTGNSRNRKPVQPEPIEMEIH